MLWQDKSVQSEEPASLPPETRSVAGNATEPYCVIRSYCATMHKQGANVFEALVAAFKGAPPQPCFA